MVSTKPLMDTIADVGDGTRGRRRAIARGFAVGSGRTTRSDRLLRRPWHPEPRCRFVARRHDLNANMLFTWRRQIGTSVLLPAGDAMTFVPAAITTEGARTVLPESPLAGRMEIVLADGDRIITGKDVDAAALARVVKVLSQR